VRVIEPMALQTAGLLPSSVRATLRHSVAVLNRQLTRRARREVDSAAARLKRAGWRVQAEVRSGAPLAELLRVVEEKESDVLIVGARAASGVKRALLGSVAAGALNRSRVPVLVVR
jgi:nucleotide-binding universal stress UspA family protein